MEDMFERALRQKLRFPSPIGALTTEQLWDLALTSRGGASLDDTARTIHREIREIGEHSFVDKRPDPRMGSLELSLEIVKHVIDVKQRERDERVRSSERAARRQKLLGILAEKEDAELQGKSREELEREIAELS